MIKIDDALIEELLRQAGESDRKRQNYDMRTSDSDTSQRMLNALLPGTLVPIHRHSDTTETVICLSGRIEEIIYDEVVSYETDDQDTLRRRSFVEKERILLCPTSGSYGCQVQKGAWHTVNVLEASVIFEAKDGAFTSASHFDVINQ